MLINQTYFIDSCDDVELNIKRESKLEFKLTYDDEKEIEAIVCIIPGLGGDSNEIYKTKLANYGAREYNIAVLAVNYHCIGNRPQTGAKFFLDNIDKFIFNTSINALNINIPYDIQKLNNFDEFYPAMDYVNKQIQKMKNNWQLDKNYYLDLSVSLQPTKNEYQNFGIMQATDILNALLYIRKNPPFKVMGGGIKHILIGSSHGGYLANLCAKISPWIIDAVIDNSSYAKTCWRLIGFGKEIDYSEHMCFGTFHFFNNIRLCCYDKTFWTINKQSPYYFSLGRRLIRDILNQKHLILQSSYPKPAYIFYHSKFDTAIAPYEDKKELFCILDSLDFKYSSYVIDDENQVDGKLIKNLDHGMGMSIKTLINKHLPQILQEPLKDKTCKKEISYKCDDLIYTFKEENDQIVLSISN
ncbi:TPA: DUF2920 family protein [Campylobacter lari]|uniref:DUF2920 family protein n=1 Tax=Campylobacter TaxID=194 RepID=UPI0010599DCD|nr:MULTISPECIES: DUF2920 family protein [Campylobacter]EAI4440459.1 DUF2920 family protein [Campylobacter lari]EDP6879236.1 DUF2920 family protein [Campylobacter lari]MCV3409212.1 DUF2920 family protein [Campylobacter sp. IFREMER_LSEM_CL1890]MCV3548113.1 DUF2920 family protein [Campylobacter sp. CNRCH_2013_0671h]TDJ91574.1 DUF2920 family protein [Campylobacter lari]